MAENQQPDEIDPAEDDPERYRQHREDQREELFVAQPCRPAHAKFHDPVHDRNEQQQKLDDKVLFIKPFCHIYLPPFYCAPPRGTLSINIISQLL